LIFLKVTFNRCKLATHQKESTETGRPKLSCRHLKEGFDKPKNTGFGYQRTPKIYK